MRGSIRNRNRSERPQTSRGAQDSVWARWVLTSLAISFLGVFLLLPLLNVFGQGMSRGLGPYWKSLTNPDTQAAIRLTLLVSIVCVPLNIVFGLAASWLIAKFDFRGKALLITLIDLPFAVSPVISGLIYVLLFGLQGWLC